MRSKLLYLLVVLAMLVGAIPAAIPAAASDEEVVTLPPMELPEKGNPKLDTQLNKLVSAETPEEATSYAQTLNIGLEDGNVRVIVECMPGQVDAAIEAAIALGATIETGIHHDMFQISVPLSSLLALADTPAIRLVRLPIYAVPYETSEGVALINADDWQAAGHTGAGVKIAILDIGFSGYGALLGTELPATVTTQSLLHPDYGDINGPYAQPSNHGTACAEIVYDIAPDAEYYLVNYGTDLEILDAINYLIGEGIDIISHSCGSPLWGPGDGSGTVCNKIAEARANGILWSQAMGNYAKRHWCGDYADTNGNFFNEFSQSPFDETVAVYIEAEQIMFIELKWDDEWGASSNDYSLWLFDPNLAFIGYTTGEQDGDDDPYEWFIYEAEVSGAHHIAIRWFSGSQSVNFHLYSEIQPIQTIHQRAYSSLTVPADSTYAMSVGAVPWDNPTTLEYFSSQGPNDNGDIKPDLVAPDQVENYTYGTFGGTSASTPHAAGAAALVLEAYPGYTPADIQAYLEASAIEIGGDGKDNQYGSGRLSLGDIPIDFGETLSGSIDAAAEMDTYTFTADADDTVLIRMVEASGSLYPEIRLIAPDATILETDYGSPADIYYEYLPQGGVYKILAYDHSGSETGDYNIFLQRTNNPGNTIPIAFGDAPNPASIDTTAQMDTHTFSTDDGDTVIIRMAETSGFLYPEITLFEPDGSEVSTDYGAPVEIYSLYLNEGQHTILAYDHGGDDTGEYNVVVQRMNNPGFAIPIGFGDTLVEAIEEAVDWDTFTFTSSTGQTVLIRMVETSGLLYPEIALFRPDGSYLHSDYGSPAEIISDPLPQNGVYKILAYDHSGYDTGDYNIFLQLLGGAEGSISGHVYEENGTTPIEGATVSVYVVDPLLPYIKTWAPIGEDTTDGSGQYSITGLPAGDYKVAAVVAGHERRWHQDVQLVSQAATLTLAEGQAIGNIDFSLGPGGTISGTVIDQNTLLPIENVTVSAGPFGVIELAALALTDENGDYILDGLPYGDYGVSSPWAVIPGSGADNYIIEAWQEKLVGEAGDAVNVAEGVNPGYIDFTLEEGCVISGYVRTEGGAPIEGAAVFVWEYGSLFGGPWALRGYGRTDANGDYQTTGLPNGTCAVRVNAISYATEWWENTYHKDLSTPVVVTGRQRPWLLPGPVLLVILTLTWPIAAPYPGMHRIVAVIPSKTSISTPSTTPIING